eukprot:CAMPEP_0194078196 /NCGR_PEP_ID=MMETSP0149-20130528/4640_1 /TAXON_ID=122233 /ORGANISM="Chaetoceros debilis, Strain MM31A-1" /LENGTH=767 /DNA_ID=CAMNT_0038759403 /DNA_START=37 /DNA_END=2337 /DNA_ORIENTATION=-
MTIATTVGITMAISVALVALLAAHQNQSYQIHELSRRLSEVLDADQSTLVLSRRTTEEAPVVGSYTYASDFGVVGDSMANDGPALQAAIDSAANKTSGQGGTVILPKGIFITTQPLIIPGGITLQGQGYGSSPLAIKFDAGGSTIAYCGTDYAVKIIGSSSGMRDVAVYDWPYHHGEFDDGCPNIKAAGGVLVKADGQTVESVALSNVFIYFFVGGDALSLIAVNNGGVAFGYYENLRLRHAHTGIKLYAEVDSFVNTNTFVGGAISGGDFHYGIKSVSDGDCNDNKFYGISIGMYDSDVAHVYVAGSTTNIKMDNVRLEAKNKDMSRPIIIIEDSSYGNVMNGMLGHTHIQANLNRNPDVDFMSQKSVGLDPAPVNQFWNAAFKGSSGTDIDESGAQPNRVMPGWKLEGGSATTPNANVFVLEDDDGLYPDHNVLKVDYRNFGGAFKMMADQTLLQEAHSFVTFGVYARTSVQGSISAAMRYTSGSIISSGSHSGSGEWEFIGMSALYSKSAPYFYFSITGDVDLTAPTLTFGKTPATPGASLMSSSGARMSGTLTTAVGIGLPPPPSTPVYKKKWWVLPKNEGNVFLMQSNADHSIERLNYRAADRFPRGTVITLFFDEPGTKVESNSYIELTSGEDFVSAAKTSITLITQGSGSWDEVSRNAGRQLVQSSSTPSCVGAPPESGNYWVLPKSCGTVFLMQSGSDIRRLSYRTADRFPYGTVITLVWEEAGNTVVDSSYMKLKNGQNFVSGEQTSLTLMTKGSAIW